VSTGEEQEEKRVQNFAGIPNLLAKKHRIAKVQKS
jgi:hypothetical protein